MNFVVARTFIHGALAMGGWVAGLFFLRFWRQTRERLFVFFFLAFWILSCTWAALGFVPGSREALPYIFGMRLAAFGLIIVGVVDKNRRSRLP